MGATLVADLMVPGQLRRRGDLRLGTPMTPDHALAERMAAGDERALGELYDRHGRVMYALACAIVGERTDADEVVVDSFGQAWRTAAHFDPARGSVAAWLATITRTRALDFVRARGRRSRALVRAAVLSEHGVASPVAAGDAPDRGTERAEAGRLVTRALAVLPEPQRRAIQLAYFGGLSQSEIAGELGEPLGTVKTRIRDGMAKLRELLRGTGGGAI
jgi:RNA polymerase sigma-70 factor (ECF subfamily)